MSVSLAAARNLLTEMLNESLKSDAFGTISSLKERYKTTELEYYCAITDAVICRQLILDKDGRAKDFITTSTVAHGADIPTHVGQVDSFFFTVTGGVFAGTRAPEVATTGQIELDNRNPQALTHIRPRLALAGDKVFHSAAGLVAGGASAATLTASYYVLTVNLSACQAPDEMMRAVVLGAFALAIQKDGHKSNAATIAHGMYQAELRVRGVSQMELPQG